MLSESDESFIFETLGIDTDSSELSETLAYYEDNFYIG
jgi:hypothetical protein